MTFETFDQSVKKTWPDQKKPIYLPTYLPCDTRQSCRLVTIETLITILIIENLNSWQSLLPDNQEWHWTAFAILAMFNMLFNLLHIMRRYYWNWNIKISDPKLQRQRKTEKGHKWWSGLKIGSKDDKRPRKWAPLVTVPTTKVKSGLDWIWSDSVATIIALMASLHAPAFWANW